MKKLSIILFILMLLAVEVYADPYGPYRNKYIEGYLISISKDKVTIEEYDGTFHSLNILSDAILTIDGIPVTYSDFIPGMEVYGTIQGRSIKTLEAYSTENPGYIPPGKKVVKGTVKSLDFNSITIKLPSGEEETYTYTPATIITRDKNPIAIDKLYEGDSVRLFFDEYNTNTISRISVEGDSILISGLYKGTLSFKDSYDNRVALENVKRLSSFQWSNYSDLILLNSNEDLPIYIGGQKINPANLKYYRGREVYLAVKNVFGQETIEKMTLKSTRERNYTEKISDVNYYSDSFTLNNKQNLTLSDSTIIVKNNRLVDKYSVNPESSAFIVADTGLGNLANLIYIYDEDLNNSNIGQSYLYYGRLDEVIDYMVLLKDYYVLDRNEWDRYRRSTELTYDDDTYIFDITNKKLITVQEFQAGNYAVDEDSDYADDRDLEDWYGYLYTSGDNILVMGLVEEKDDLLSQRVTAGTVKSTSTDPYVGQVIYLTDSRDWSSRNSSFMPKAQDLRLMIEDALIIKDDKLISKDDLKPGDRLYIVRDDFKCKFILVK